MNNLKEAAELIELFQHLGGEFENAGIGHNIERGFYCYTLDSNKNSIISCPANLLIDVSDLNIREEGLIITSPEKYGENIIFLKKYLRFHFNGDFFKQFFERKQQIDSLTDNEISLISRVYPKEVMSTKNESTLDYAKKQIITSHKIDYLGKYKLMPFVTFLNHSVDGAPYDVDKDNVSVVGKFSDEIFAYYCSGDVMTIAATYGFVTDSIFSYSLPMSFVLKNNVKVFIQQNIGELSYTKKGIAKPLVHENINNIIISWFPVYCKGRPFYPLRVANMIESETGLPAKEILENVYRNNFNALNPLVLQLKDSQNVFARNVAEVVQRQLDFIGTNKFLHLLGK